MGDVKHTLIRSYGVPTVLKSRGLRTKNDILMADELAALAPTYVETVALPKKWLFALNSRGRLAQCACFTVCFNTSFSVCFFSACAVTAYRVVSRVVVNFAQKRTMARQNLHCVPNDLPKVTKSRVGVALQQTVTRTLTSCLDSSKEERNELRYEVAARHVSGMVLNICEISYLERDMLVDIKHVETLYRANTDGDRRRCLQVTGTRYLLQPHVSPMLGAISMFFQYDKLLSKWHVHIKHV